MSELIRRYGTGLTGFMVLASAIWLLGMVILPDLLMVELSFKPIDSIARVWWG